MRHLVLVAIGLLLAAAPARASVQFDGHAYSSSGGSVGIGWSSDLGPGQGAQFPLILDYANNFTDSASVARAIAGGEVGASARLHVAPAGPADLSAPVLTYVTHASAQSSGMYGLSANTVNNSGLYLTPPAGGGPTYYAIAWHLSPRSTGVGAAATWTIWQGYTTLASSAGVGDTVGVFVSSLPSNYSALGAVHVEAGAGTSGGYIGEADITVTLQVYLDGSPFAGVDGITAPAALEFAAPRPNPVRDGAKFAFALPAQGEVSLQVLDVSGRVMRELLPGELSAGRHELRWDRRDSSGGAVKPGVYWARLALARGDRTETARQRLVVLQ